MTEPDMIEHRDVLIVGAGLSGIGAAHHVQAAFGGKTYAILEARDTIGGTWDLFRYPGVRSDSDMFTLGYRFRPWTEAQAIADGPSTSARPFAPENGVHVRHDLLHAVQEPRGEYRLPASGDEKQVCARWKRRDRQRGYGCI